MTEEKEDEIIQLKLIQQQLIQYDQSNQMVGMNTCARVQLLIFRYTEYANKTNNAFQFIEW